MKLLLPLIVLVFLLHGAQEVLSDLVRVDLSGQKAWRLSNANGSISLPTAVPAHTLSVLAAAGIIAEDPLYRYGERDTRWVSEDRWNFTLLWSGKQHKVLGACRHIVLVLYGIDTFGSVVLNGRHVLEANNAHRSWWVPLGDAAALREGANMLSVVLPPAVAQATRAKAIYPYSIPTMQVPGGLNVYNFARKPAFDFGWDWGPAFVPAGITGGVQLVGFDRAQLIGALVTQQLNSSSSTFTLTVTAQFLVPLDGDTGTLSVTLAMLEIHKEQPIQLQPGVVGGNQMQALVTMQLEVPAKRVQLWQPLTFQPRGKPRELYDLVVMFEPSNQPTSRNNEGTCGNSNSPDSSTTSTTTGSSHSSTSSSSAATASLPEQGPASTGSAGVQTGKMSASGDPPPELSSTVVRRIGFRTVELVQQAMPAATQELLSQAQPGHVQPENSAGLDNDGASATATANSVGVSTSNQDIEIESPATATGTEQPDAVQQLQQHQQQQHTDVKQASQGESFYFRVNGKPLYAKGANMIPLHILSTAVTPADVRALLQSAVNANMNMIRIWGGGMYQMDELYEAADELGLLVWQEAMFACSPYPRNGDFLSNVEAEVTQQLLRLGSHASLAIFGGNNEVEQSLEWYQESKDNVAMFVTDYNTLFVETIGSVVQQMLPGIPWLDSSPSKGLMWLPNSLGSDENRPQTSLQPGTGAVQHDAPTGNQTPTADSMPDAQEAGRAAGVTTVKRWGNSNDPAFGDVHFYNYRDDCQDWRTYPAARFISEYGWQSYPSWSSYAAATASQDWSLASDMTEYRQRHPNGTVELLAQLQRRFKLPQAWQQVLLHQQQASLQRQHEEQEQQEQQAVGIIAPSAFCSRNILLRKACQLVGSIFSVAKARLGVQYGTGGATGTDSSHSTAAAGTTTSSSSSGKAVGTSKRCGLVPGRRRSSKSSSRSSSQVLPTECDDMPHFVYLTQVQQMLCYETALHYWRRLRADASTLSMGVLYWQLNDVWAGASWSSIDYGGVWKPVQYGIARAFADVALSVQHDLHNDTIQVHVVNDLHKAMQVQVAIRLLSLKDTSAQCGHISNTRSSSSSSTHSGRVTHGNTGNVSYVRYRHIIMSVVAPGSAPLIWSSSVSQLLHDAGGRCSRQSCYVHIGLSAAGYSPQEATVWMAGFKELQLQPPQLQLSNFLLSSVAAAPGRNAAAEGTSTGTEGTRTDNTPLLNAAGVVQQDNQGTPDTAGAASKSAGAGSYATAGPLAGAGNDAVVFTVSSKAVAVFAVWETQGPQAPGHFSDNALTIHPCEPKHITFIPNAARRDLWQSFGTTARSQVHGSSMDSSNGGEPAAATAGVQEGLVAFLQEQMVVSSLWEHQQFDGQQQQVFAADGTAAL